MKRYMALVMVAMLSGSCTKEQTAAVRNAMDVAGTVVQNALQILGMVLTTIDLVSGPAQTSLRTKALAAQQALYAESQAVRENNTPLDTPARITAAFPQFRARWSELAVDATASNAFVIDTGVRGAAARPLGTRVIPEPEIVRAGR
jgi:hypothetical protein